MCFPASELSQQSKEVLHFPTGIIFELLVVFVQVFWQLDNVVFDFIFNHWVNIKFDALAVLVTLVQRNLEFNFAKFCYHVMEAVT